MRPLQCPDCGGSVPLGEAGDSIACPYCSQTFELPAEYVDALRAQNLVPLWPSLRAVLPPGQPRPNTRPICWPYAALRPLLVPCPATWLRVWPVGSRVNNPRHEGPALWEPLAAPAN